GISDKIKKILEMVQKPVMKVVDWVIGKAVGIGKRLIGVAKRVGGKIKAGAKKLTAKVKKKLGIKEKTPEQIEKEKEQRLDRGLRAAATAANRLKGKPMVGRLLAPAMKGIQVAYRMPKLELVEHGHVWAVQRAKELDTQVPVKAADDLPAKRARAEKSVADIDTFFRQNAGNSRLAGFVAEKQTISNDLDSASPLANGSPDAETITMLVAEFDSIESRAKDLLTRAKAAVPEAAAEGEKPKYVTENRVPRDAETFLAGTGYSRTGKSIKGAQIFRDSDGRYFHRDTLHVGEAAEIEFYDPAGKHLGTKNPVTGAVTGGPVKGRSLDRYL
ncbi:MAG: hypothetical protein WCG47_23885, partial [Dermatophilaceae bacterium]